MLVKYYFINILFYYCSLQINIRIVEKGSIVRTYLLFCDKEEKSIIIYYLICIVFVSTNKLAYYLV